MKGVLSRRIGKSKDNEVEDEDSEEDEDNKKEEINSEHTWSDNLEKLQTLSPEGLSKTRGKKQREKWRAHEETQNESQCHGGDLQKPNKKKDVIHGKAKGAEDKEPHKKEKLNVTEKGERSKKSDPKTTKKRLENLGLKKKEKRQQQEHKKKEASEKSKDKKPAGKTKKDPGKWTEGKTKKKEQTKVKKEKKVKKLKVKKQEVEKKVKHEKIKAKKPKKTKTKKEKKQKNPKKSKKK